MSEAQDKAIAAIESVRRGDNGITILSAVVAEDGTGEALVSISAALAKAAAPCGKCNGTGRDYWTYSETYSDHDCFFCGGRGFGEGWGKGATVHRVPLVGACPETRKLGKTVGLLVRDAWARAVGL